MGRRDRFPADALVGLHVLVVDDDPEARELLRTVLEYAGALVTVVAVGPAGVLDALEARGAVVERRGFHPGDLAGAFLCVASSDDPGERAAIAREARARGVLVNVMDDVANCDFAAPAVVRRGDLVIAVGTGGRSPALARCLREELSERFGPEWSGVLEVLGRVRDESLRAFPDLGERAARWQAALDTEELTALIRAGRADEAASRLRARLFVGSESESVGAP
jgi:siroheme synthase-like protein